MSDLMFLLKSLDDEQSVLIDKEMIVGRDQACAIVLEQGQASRQHAKVSPSQEGIRVEDLKSTNGTLVNGKKISEPVVLKEGDELRIGKQRFIVQPASADKKTDPDATMLFSVPDQGAEAEAKPASYAKTVPETPAAPDSKPAATKEKPKAAAKDLSDSNAPPAWVLNNQQAVDGTKFIARDVMQGVLQQSAGAVNEKVNAPTLIGSSDPIIGMRFQLSGDKKMHWEIGRATSCQVMINHDSVSSSHAQIINEGGRWKLVDLMSANGTYVNAKKGLSSYLSSGDVLRFGQVECTFALPEGSNKKPNVKVSAPKKESAGGGMIKTALIAFTITGILAAAVIFGASFLT
jgi:pSer/pThr/pTyr-binding forkhead associated (FHA) protein